MSRKIGLLDVDSHNFPNLPLMKLSTYHKKCGDDVKLYTHGNKYDKVFVSKVFTESVIPPDINADDIEIGGSGYNLSTKLPYDVEHSYPDYSLYPQYEYALGWMTRGCPRVNHKFCITPNKDGCKSVQVANLSEFWSGQKHVKLLDQNFLACRDKIDMIKELAESNATIEFTGGSDIRFMDDSVINAFRSVKIKDFHFAWDDPKENLEPYFKNFATSGLKNPDKCYVFVLTNYWSSLEEDFYRVYKLRELGFLPYIMIYDRQKFVTDSGHWIKGVENIYSTEQLRHFKTLQHMQRWCNAPPKFIKVVPNFEDYEWYKRWKANGMKVPGS